jgi:hypothetical protein
MRRRAFLGTVGAAALAGCSGDDGSESDPTPTTSASRGSAEFEFVGVQAPESVQLNVPDAFALGVRNVGSAEGTFTSPLRTKLGDGEWNTAGEISMTIPAGETGEWQSGRFMPRYLETIRFHLVAFDERWSIQVEPKRLDFEKYYDVPTGVRLNALGGTFESAYPTATNETAVTPTSASDGETWAIIRLDARNRLREPLEPPEASEFVLEVDGERRPQHQDVSDDPYEGGTLDARTVRRGDLVYAVPEGTSAADLTFWWESSLEEGDVKVIWTK